MYNPTWLEKLEIGLPYFDAVNLLALPNTQEKVYYSAPMPGRVALVGLHFNNSGFNVNLLSIGIADTSEAPVWTPERVPLGNVLKQPSDADPVASFFQPYVLEKGARVQFKLQNDEFTGLNTQTRITLIGLRLPEDV